MTWKWPALTKITIVLGVSSDFCHIQVCVQVHSAILWYINLLLRLRSLCAVLRIYGLNFSWIRLILNCYIPKIGILIDWLIDRFILLFIYLFIWNRDSVVSIATCYGLEGPEIESRWGEIFRTYPDRLRDPPSLLYNGYRVFPGGKGGRGVMLTTYPLQCRG
jgi:hypothetical protein